MLSRKFFDHDLWTEKRKFSRAEAFVDLIRSANFAPKRVLVGNAFIHLERGQQVASLRFLATRWGWGKNKVSAFLSLLESDQIIGQQQTHGQTVLTLCNYDTYNTPSQGDGTEIGTPAGQERDSDGTKQKKVKKERSIFVRPTVADIQEYGKTLNPQFRDAQKFVDYYESNGWKVGRNSMKDWKATVRNWHRKEHPAIPSKDYSKMSDGTRIDGGIVIGGKLTTLRKA